MSTQTALSQQNQDTASSFNGGLILTIVSGVLMLTALYMALIWAPDAANLTAPAERYAQRIFYFHVPSAWIGFLAFIVAAVTAVLYLATRQQQWDMWGLASVNWIGLFYDGYVQRSHLGQANLECVVDVGTAPDHFGH